MSCQNENTSFSRDIQTLITILKNLSYFYWVTLHSAKECNVFTPVCDSVHRGGEGEGSVHRVTISPSHNPTRVTLFFLPQQGNPTPILLSQRRTIEELVEGPGRKDVTSKSSKGLWSIMPCNINGRLCYVDFTFIHSSIHSFVHSKIFVQTCTSSSVNFSPRLNMTCLSSAAVINPSPSLSNTLKIKQPWIRTVSNLSWQNSIA